MMLLVSAAFAIAAEPVEPWRTTHAPPRAELPAFTPAELRAFVVSGEHEVDQVEALLAWAGRARGAIDVAIAELLHALRQGDRLAKLGCHLDDYAREVLDLGEHTARNLARLGRELPSRPLLRDALRSGRVRLRAAETVLSVATGGAEAMWVERAQRLTVRALEREVRRARGASGDDTEPWLAFRVRLRPDERVIVDDALELAGEVLPGSTRAERLEAMAQELLAEVSTD